MAEFKGKLTKQQYDTLKLIERSRPDEDGWVTVESSAVFDQLIRPMPTSLVQWREIPYKMAAKLTPTALTLLEWMGPPPTND